MSGEKSDIKGQSKRRVLVLIGWLLTVPSAVAEPQDSFSKVSGVWVSASSPPNQIVLNVSRTADHVSVIEVLRDDEGSKIINRVYVIGGAAVSHEIGVASSKGRKMTLRFGDTAEEWRLDRAKRKLTVIRPGNRDRSERKVVLHRSSQESGVSVQ